MIIKKLVPSKVIYKLPSHNSLHELATKFCSYFCDKIQKIREELYNSSNDHIENASFTNHS